MAPVATATARSVTWDPEYFANASTPVYLQVHYSDNTGFTADRIKFAKTGYSVWTVDEDVLTEKDRDGSDLVASLFLTFPISWPTHGRHRRRLILRTEPLNNGQIYSLLPEDTDPDDFPLNLIDQDLVQGSPLEGPCRQIQFLDLEGINTSEESWDEHVMTIGWLRQLADREELPSELSSFAYIVGPDDDMYSDAAGDAGRGAWSATRLGPLLTKEYLNEASEHYARVNSGATTNGWH
ncbi:hypothetical protein VPNG_10146 [Cytospora leucostoma]|uniref:Uncharacterized protein n=1 Tax=Cytospora leucostoma TaxID=1230097 RepID=A0A423VFG9_9PEZI|nr:hypothetical protein VPNG_10146 [Cytospora leucostoma]